MHLTRVSARAISALLVLLVVTACGGGSSDMGGLGGGAPTPGTPAKVVLIVEENKTYESVVGTGAMAYLDQLASQGTLATNYYANTHPSIGNYFMMTTGQIITNDDHFAGVISDDNIARRLISAGKSWKVYAESIPSAGYLGGDTVLYSKHHNPFAYFSDVVNNPAQAANIVPFSQLATDLAAAALPDFTYIIPNLQNDAHDGTMQQADDWLRSHLGPLFSNADFQRNGLLIIAFDESEFADTAHGGGHIAVVFAGPRAKAAFKAASFYQHQNLLRQMLQSVGVNSFPGAAGAATGMSEVLK